MDFFKVHSSSFSISAIDSIVFKTAMLAYLQAGHDQFIRPYLCMTFPQRELAQVTLCQQQTYLLIEPRPASHRTPCLTRGPAFLLCAGLHKLYIICEVLNRTCHLCFRLLLRSQGCATTKNGLTEEHRGT